MAHSKEQPNDSGDDFVNIWTTEEGQVPTAESRKKDSKDFYEQWVAKCKLRACLLFETLSVSNN